MSAELQDAVALSDDLLEIEINHACARLSMAVTQEQAWVEFEQLRILIAQRSPGQVERLERARALRK